MKKCIFSALFLVLALFVAQYANARQVPDSKIVTHADDYCGVTINGVEITESNASRPIKDKKVYYSVKENTLILDNETLYFDNCVGIRVDGKRARDLKILIKGTCHLNSSYTGEERFGQAVVESDYPILVVGEEGTDPKLFIESERRSVAFQMNDCPLKMQNLSVKMSGGRAVWGVEKGKHTCFIVDNANVDATSTSFGAFVHIDGVSLMHAEFETKGFYSEEDRCIMKDPFGVALEVRITNVVKKPTYYGIKVAGVMVTTENYFDVKGEGIEGGSVYYDRDKHTLNLEDVTINAGTKRAITCESGNSLTVVVSGNVSMYSQADCAVSTSHSINFLGIYDHLLDIQAQQGIGIDGLNIGFYDITKAHIVGHEAAITGRKDLTEVSFSESSVQVVSTNRAISNIDYLWLLNSVIADEGYIFDSYRHAVIDNKGGIATAVTIKPKEVMYGLWVGGVPVTNLNFEKIESPEIKGQVSYDHHTHTLVLTDAHITSDAVAIEVDRTYKGTAASSLRIECNGTCVINAKQIGLELARNTTVNVMDDSSLEINANLGVGMYDGYYIFQGDVLVLGNDVGMSSLGGETATVAMRNFEGEIHGDHGAISDIADLTFEHCSMVYPEGLRFDRSEKAVMDGNTKAVDVGVQRDERIAYGLKVAGVEVTSLNCDFITTPRVSPNGVIQGPYPTTYDPESKTLTLNDARIITSEMPGIENTGVDGLIIKCKGSSSITSTYGYGIVSNKDFSIEGDPKQLPNLKVTSELYKYPYHCMKAIAFVDVSDRTLTVRHVNLDLYSDEWGIYSVEGYANVGIYGSNVDIHGMVGSISSFNVVDCKVVEPTNGLDAFKDGAFRDDNDRILRHVKIEIYDLGINIAGIPITSANYMDIMSAISEKSPYEGAISGKVSYNPESNTLTLDNASIEVVDDNVIEVGYNDGLTIKCIGNSQLESYTGRGLDINNGDCSIVGDADGSSSLKLYSTVFVNTSTLTFQDMNVEVDAHYDRYGFEGLYSDDRAWTASVVLRHSNMTVKGKTAAVYDFDKFDLIDCYLERPVGGYFDLEDHCMRDENGNFATEIEIVADDISGLENTKMDADDPNAPMFDLTGRQIYNPYRGQIYIQNGRKKIAL